MTVLSDLDDDIPLDALIQKKKNENNNGNKEPEKIIPLSGNRFASWFQIQKSFKVGFVPDGHLVRIPPGAVKRRRVTHPTLEGSFCISVFQNTPRRSNKLHDLISIVTRDPRSARCEIFCH